MKACGVVGSHITGQPRNGCATTHVRTTICRLGTALHATGVSSTPESLCRGCMKMQPRWDAIQV